MAYSPSFIRAMIGRPVHGGGQRQRRARSSVQKMFKRDVVAPDRDWRERAAGMEVEDRLDARTVDRTRSGR